MIEINEKTNYLLCYQSTFATVMKKSTIGIVLLVAMVLTKAFLVDNEDVSENGVARTSEFVENHTFIEEVRNEIGEDETEVILKGNLIASNFSNPDLSRNVRTTVVTENAHDAEVPDLNLFASLDIHDLNGSNVEEVIPMDNMTNTGYGMWKRPTEEIISKSDRKGAVPLDIGNTISDNMSKMFPRIPQ